jgi:hypothetical protein
VPDSHLRPIQRRSVLATLNPKPSPGTEREDDGALRISASSVPDGRHVTPTGYIANIACTAATGRPLWPPPHDAELLAWMSAEAVSAPFGLRPTVPLRMPFPRVY